MSDLLQEKSYVIAEDPDGRLYFYIATKEEEPQKYPDPKIVYDGKDHAILQRKPAQDIVLDFINEDFRDVLKKSYSVMVVESLMDNITAAYHATLEHVPQLPIELNLQKH